MTAQVASPARAEALDKLQGSRRSILANMSPPRSHSELLSTSPQAQEADLAEEDAAPAVAAPALAASHDEEEEVVASVDDELSTPMGKTDSLLRARSKNSQSFGSSLRRKSVAKDATPEPPLTGINGGYTGTATNRLQVPNGNGNGNGSMNRLRRRLSNLSTSSKKSNNDDDRASIHSNLSSHREAISSFIRRTRSRSSSKEPEADLAADNGRRSSVSGRRNSIKIPGMRSRKGSSAKNGDEEVPPLPVSRTRSSQTSNSSAAPEGYPASSTSDNSRKGSVNKKTRARTSSETSSSGGSKANGSAAPATPSRKGRGSKSNGEAAKEKETEKKEEEKENGDASQSYLGAATAAVAGAGAAVGGTAAALVSKVTGNAGQEDGYQSESDEEDDVFHDADLADIHEGDEDEEDEDENQAGGNSQAAYHRAGRSRGLSEASGTASKAAQDDDEDGDEAGAAAGGAAAGGAAGAAVASRGPSKLKGTSGAKRRAGSDPANGNTGTSETPADAKAKKEVPAEVREKSAKVSKLRFDDVTQTTESMNEDLDVARKVLDLFLNSRMIEAEEIIKEHADSRMYYALGYGLIATIKGFMTFEPQDLAIAISFCRDSMNIANLLRKQSNAVANLGRFVRGTGHGPGAMAQMTPVQRHAELVYAESMLLKAVLGIVHSGDVFSFVAEALNMRTAYGIYRSLGKYVETADSKAPGGFDKAIDQDFRSGTFLGNGLISLILGLLPSKVLKIMDVFGYTGDTKVGLETLMRPGGWSQSPKQKKPKMNKEDEGIRRSICDMALLLYHLVLSSFLPVTGVDIPFAERILDVHLKRYPESVFFLFFSGRLYSTQALPEQAIVQFEKARKAQDEYRELHNLCHWDTSLCRMSLSNWAEAQECFSTLLDSSNWSPCVYAYGKAANTLQHDPDNADAAATMAKVPSMMQRIAGKSIPLEKFVAKKAHQFNEQGHLLLPGIEFSYAFHCLSNAPRWSLTDEQLVAISDALSELNEVEDPSQYKGGVDAYYDDLALCHFLRGVTLRYIAHPEQHSKVKPAQSDIPIEEAEEQAILSFNTVIENGHKIHHCTQYLYFSRYELGRLYATMGQKEKAVDYLELVLSGKQLEDKGNRSTKHKYPLQNMCLLRSNGALTTIRNGGR